MEKKKLGGALFECQTARFDMSGLNPDYKKRGSSTTAPYYRRATAELVKELGPGRYNDTPGTFSSSALQRKAAAWIKMEEMKRMAEKPHQHSKDNRILMQDVGPGRNTRSFTDQMDKRSSGVPGVSCYREARFQQDRKFCRPGPGTYGNPYTLLEERDKKRGSNKGLMDIKTKIRQPLGSAGSGLGPGSYNLKGPIDQKLERIASEKNRKPRKAFKPMWYRPPLVLDGQEEQLPEEKVSKPKSLYMPKSFVDELESENNKSRGKFGKQPQYPKVPTERICCSSLAHCPRPPNSPGPGHYEVKRLFSPVKESAVPFHSSAKRFDRRTRQLFGVNTNPVGVGQYNLIKHWKGKSADCYQWPIPPKPAPFLPDINREKTSEGFLKPYCVRTLYKDFPQVDYDQDIGC